MVAGEFSSIAGSHTSMSPGSLSAATTTHTLNFTDSFEHQFTPGAYAMIVHLDRAEHAHLNGRATEMFSKGYNRHGVRRPDGKAIEESDYDGTTKSLIVAVDNGKVVARISAQLPAQDGRTQSHSLARCASLSDRGQNPKALPSVIEIGDLVVVDPRTSEVGMSIPGVYGLVNAMKKVTEIAQDNAIDRVGAMVAPGLGDHMKTLIPGLKITPLELRLWEEGAPNSLIVSYICKHYPYFLTRQFIEEVGNVLQIGELPRDLSTTSESRQERISSSLSGWITDKLNTFEDDSVRGRWVASITKPVFVHMDNTKLINELNNIDKASIFRSALTTGLRRLRRSIIITAANLIAEYQHFKLTENYR